VIPETRSLKKLFKIRPASLLSFYIFVCLFSYFFFLRLTEFIPTFVVFIPLSFWLARQRKGLFQSEKSRLLLLAFGFEVFLSIAFFIIHRPADSYFISFWVLRIVFLVFWLVTLRAAPFLKDLEKLLEVLTVIFILHACLSWLMYFFPGLRSAVLETQFLTEIAKTSYAANSYGQRLTSLGIMFFGAGAFYGCVICVLLIYASEQGKKWWPWLAVIVLSLTGVLMARTALVGIIVGLGFLLHESIKRNLPRALALILGLALGMLGLWANPKTNLLVTNAMDPFAFRPVLQYLNSFTQPSQPLPSEPSTSQVTEPTTAPVAETSTTSTTAPKVTLPPPETVTSTADMITAGSKAIESTDPKTWLVGTGKVFSETGYYGGTDIGYLRLPYYGGVLFCLFFFLPVALCFFYLRRKSKVITLQYKILLAILVLQLIFNLKGIIDLSVFYIAFLMTENHQET